MCCVWPSLRTGRDWTPTCRSGGPWGEYAGYIKTNRLEKRNILLTGGQMKKMFKIHHHHPSSSSSLCHRIILLSFVLFWLSSFYFNFQWYVRTLECISTRKWARQRLATPTYHISISIILFDKFCFQDQKSIPCSNMTDLQTLPIFAHCSPSITSDCRFEDLFVFQTGTHCTRFSSDWRKLSPRLL